MPVKTKWVAFFYSNFVYKTPNSVLWNLVKADSKSFPTVYGWHSNSILLVPNLLWKFINLHCVFVSKNYHAFHSVFFAFYLIFMTYLHWIMLFYCSFMWFMINGLKLDQNFLFQSFPYENRISNSFLTRLAHLYKEASRVIIFHSFFLASSS